MKGKQVSKNNVKQQNNQILIKIDQRVQKEGAIIIMKIWEERPKYFYLILEY